MTDLPPGWGWTTLGEIAETSLGKMLDRSTFTGSNAVPYLRNVNVQWGRFELEDILTIEIPPKQQSFFALRPGDLMVCEGGEIGRCAVWPGSKTYMAFQKALHRVRPYPGVDAHFLRYLLENYNHTNALGPYSTGSTIKHLPQQQLRRLPLPLPPFAEQRRIVTVLDTYLSGLNAGLSDVNRVRRRVPDFWQSTVDHRIFDQGYGKNWPMNSLGQLSHGGDYGTSVKCSYDGLGAAVVRIPNILNGEVNLTDMKYATDPSVDLSRLHLSIGDILFVRTNGSRSLIGRTAVVDGTDARVAFASYLIRFRLHTEVVRPRWVHHALQGSICRRRLEREAASSAGQYNLSLAKLEGIQIPVPRVSEQDSILAELNDQRYTTERLGASLEVAEIRGEALRRSLLTDAFSGRLVPQDPNDEPASRLLERIKEERAAQPQLKRGQRSTKRAHSDQESML
jgi:type I restriction enzyme S subunit